LKNFSVFIIKMFAILLVIALSLDLVYTFLYTKIIDSSKFQFIKKQEDKRFNYVFLGSSRVVNHIYPKVIDSITSKKSINFGVMDAKPKDVFTLLKLLDYYNIKSDSIFIQTDYYYNSDEKSNFLYVDLIPYLRENEIITSYFQDEKDFLGLYYFPFYRYSKNNPKLGIRELLASLNRKNIFDVNKGYIGLKGNETKEGTWQRELPKKIERNTLYNDSIKNYLVANGKKSFFFTAPFRPDTKNLFFISQLKDEFSVFWDFSKQISDTKLFKNGYHLNEKGAKQFSVQISNAIISK
jgi:hypothetical protein